MRKVLSYALALGLVTSTPAFALENKVEVPEYNITFNLDEALEHKVHTFDIPPEHPSDNPLKHQSDVITRARFDLYLLGDSNNKPSAVYATLTLENEQGKITKLYLDIIKEDGDEQAYWDVDILTTLEKNMDSYELHKSFWGPDFVRNQKLKEERVLIQTYHKVEEQFFREFGQYEVK